MSIIIKNFDIPIGCQKCKFFCKHIFGNGLDYSYSCILGAKEFPMPWIKQLYNRAVDCPIVEADKEEVVEWVYDKCSACGKGIEDLIESSEWYKNENPKYCPFCGKKIKPYKSIKGVTGSEVAE